MIKNRDHLKQPPQNHYNRKACDISKLKGSPLPKNIQDLQNREAHWNLKQQELRQQLSSFTIKKDEDSLSSLERSSVRFHTSNSIHRRVYSEVEVFFTQNDVNKLKSRVLEYRTALFSNHNETSKDSKSVSDKSFTYSSDVFVNQKEEKQTLENENFELKEENKRLKIEISSKDRGFQALLIRATELEEALNKNEEEILKLKENRNDENELKTNLVNKMNELESELVKYKKRFKDAAKIAEKTEGLLKESTTKNKALEEQIKMNTVSPKVKDLYEILKTAQLYSRENKFQELFEQCIDELDIERKKVTGKLKEEMSKGMISEEKLMISDQLLLHVLKMLEVGQNKNALEMLKERKPEILSQLEDSLKSMKLAKITIEVIHNTLDDTSPFSGHTYKRRNHETDEQILKLKLQIENFEKEKLEYVLNIDSLKKSLRKSEEEILHFNNMKFELTLKPKEQDLIHFLQFEALAIEELLIEQVDIVDNSKEQFIYSDM